MEVDEVDSWRESCCKRLHYLSALRSPTMDLCVDKLAGRYRQMCALGQKWYFYVRGDTLFRWAANVQHLPMAG